MMVAVGTLRKVDIHDDERTSVSEDLSELGLPEDQVGLLEGLASTRSIRRYRDEPIPPAILRAML